MLTLEIHIKRARLSARVHARIMRDINRHVMERQWRDRVPKHFYESAYAEYGFRRRSAKYNKSKRKRWGHERPNVNTGNLRRRLTHKITATQYGSKLTMRSRLDKKIDPKEWEKMTPQQRNKVIRKQRRLADWQRREIAVMSRGEIKEERRKQAFEYRETARRYKSTRSRRIK